MFIFSRLTKELIQKYQCGIKSTPISIFLTIIVKHYYMLQFISIFLIIIKVLYKLISPLSIFIEPFNRHIFLFNKVFKLIRIFKFLNKINHISTINMSIQTFLIMSYLTFHSILSYKANNSSYSFQCSTISISHIKLLIFLNFFVF